MAPKYKLTYFDIRGRAEMIRMMFGAANVKFEDVRIKFEDWPPLKAKMPQGVMPVMEIDGKTVITQSHTIARYVARELHLYGKNNLESAFIDQIMDTILDLNNAGMNEGKPYHRGEDEAKKAEFEKTFRAEGSIKPLTHIENAIAQSGCGSGFAVSRALSLADIAIYCTIEFWRLKENLEKFPKIKAVLKSVEANKNVAKYLKERPERPF